MVSIHRQTKRWQVGVVEKYRYAIPWPNHFQRDPLPMHETPLILETLKGLLRRQKITYARVAEHLDLSEASIKRLFTRGGFTLERLEQICFLAGIRLCDLIRQAESNPEAISALTPDQERELVDDPVLLLVTFLALNSWTLAEILACYDLGETDVLRRLLRLDRLGMIELLPDNRVRRLVARNFSWRPGGPVQRYFESQVRRDFLESSFNDPGEHLRFAGGMLSRESLTRMEQSIDKLLAEMDRLIQQDSDLPLKEKFGTAAIFAIRPWEMPAFKQYRKVERRKPN